MRLHTMADIARDLEWLYQVEHEGLTQTQIAAREGMHQGHISRRLARARQYRARERQAEEQESDVTDLPYVPITSGRAEGLHYNLGDDKASSLPASPFRIAEGTGRGLKITHRNNGSKDNSVGDRKAHTPDPQGLAGGKGKSKPRGSHGA